VDEGVKKVRKLKRYKVDQNSLELRNEMANSEKFVAAAPSEESNQGFQFSPL
jgi:hypothetical protein